MVETLGGTADESVGVFSLYLDGVKLFTIHVREKDAGPLAASMDFGKGLPEDDEFVFAYICYLSFTDESYTAFVSRESVNDKLPEQGVCPLPNIFSLH